MRHPRLAAAATVALLGIGLPLSQTWFFGKTDYRREADAIVIFGARVYADGRPSDSLADRVRTGVELYHGGLAPRIVMSGGPGEGATHETEAMRDLAIELGVPADAIELDRGGLDTRSTVANTRAPRVLAVSHHWHLPRIKMAYRQAGRTAYTVPARESYVIRQTPYLMAREVAAFWWYWARGALA
jgi:vancomycin permeability regulator SanA